MDNLYQLALLIILLTEIRMEKRAYAWGDVFSSIANYLIKNGYPTSDIKDPKEVYDSIFSYNHSDNYVRVVLELRNEIEKELSLN